jgi:putative transcriptional regulator
MNSPPLDGQLLVASPHLDDEQFAQTVVLVIHQQQGAACGLVLNHQTEMTVEAVWREMDAPPCHSQQRVCAGGPVSGPMIALHSHSNFAELEVAPDVFLSVHRDSLDWVVRHAEPPCRLFVGAASWSDGQLDEELARGDWLVLPASRDLVFDGPDDLWPRAVNACGRRFYHSIGIRRLPTRLNLN